MVPLKTLNIMILNTLCVLKNVSFYSFATVVGYAKFI